MNKEKELLNELVTKLNTTKNVDWTNLEQLARLILDVAKSPELESSWKDALSKIDKEKSNPTEFLETFKKLKDK